VSSISTAGDGGQGGVHVPCVPAVKTHVTVLPTNELKGATADQRAGKYLIFHLGAEEFGIPVQKVREIMGVQDITHVPQTPAHAKGVINLRGKVIPVVDLRLKFAMPAQEYTHRTCIIVVEVCGDRGIELMGVVVDGVAEVLNVASTDVEDTPSFGKEVDIPCVLGLAKHKGKVKILLEMDQVKTAHELARLDLTAK
jgi:purine-binding chemotaxis protein CheW